MKYELIGDAWGVRDFLICSSSAVSHKQQQWWHNGHDKGSSSGYNGHDGSSSGGYNGHDGSSSSGYNGHDGSSSSGYNGHGHEGEANGDLLRACVEKRRKSNEGMLLFKRP